MTQPTQEQMRKAMQDRCYTLETREEFLARNDLPAGLLDRRDLVTVDQWQDALHPSSTRTCYQGSWLQAGEDH